MAGRFYKSYNCYNREEIKASECADHRTITLIAHASKIMLRLLGKRQENKAKYFIGNTVWIQNMM